MALILLVNGITDAEQKGKQARSVAGIAETAGQSLASCSHASLPCFCLQ